MHGAGPGQHGGGLPLQEEQGEEGQGSLSEGGGSVGHRRGGVKRTILSVALQSFLSM